MSYLVVGLIVFLGIHSVSIIAPGWRDARQAKMGEGPWKGLYSVISIVGFGLVIYGYGLARQQPDVLYTPVFPLLLAAYLPGRLKRAAKHPMLLAVKFWALAHLLANGSLADVLLFGGFLVWAVTDRISMKHRVQRPLPGAPPSPMNDVIAIVVGLVIYALFVFWAHAWLIGVAPM
jgi:uncharacterized membrane protein